MTLYIRFIVAIFLSFSISTTGCKKFVEVNAPTTSINEGNVYDDNMTAAAVLTGIYAKMSSGDIGSFANLNSINFFTGLSSDELELFEQGNQVYTAYYKNSLNANIIEGMHFWVNIYAVIFVANSAIEGLEASVGLAPPIKDHLLGEAKFMRAFCFFYLVNLYGDVPLVLSTDYKVNSTVARTNIDLVYSQILQDLTDAKTLLSDNYLKPDIKSTSIERVRPNKHVAEALLARVNLYIGDYKAAEKESSTVIESGDYDLLSLDDVFLNYSNEAIWQLYPVGTGENANTPEGRLFVLPSTGPGFMNPVYLSNRLVNSFSANDHRSQKWISTVTVDGHVYNYAFKYKIGRESVDASEYSTVFRLAEQYLIRAEARLKNGNLSGAIQDVNKIRKRAGLSEIENVNKEDLVKEIALQRELELFTEWGHRWLDLKRTNTANDILKPIKGDVWQTTDQLFPVPQSDIDKNVSLKGKQNPGYN